MKTAILFYLLALSGTLNLNAQRFARLNANNINVGFGLGGNLFSVLPDSIVNGQTAIYDTLYFKFEAPKASGIKAVYTSSLWMTAQHNNSLHASYQRYRTQFELPFNDGPVWSNYNGAYYNYFSRVFKVTRQDISEHLIHFPLVNSTVTPWSVLYWPAEGNPYVQRDYSINLARHFAPFFDADSDGLYNPLHGDLPKLCGEEAVFFMLNDANRQTRATDSAEALGVEIRGFAEVFIDPNSSIMKGALNNTVFVRYEIENLSSNDYTDFRVGLFEDPDLGNLTNDRVLPDTSLNLMYCYNGTDRDENRLSILGYSPFYASHGVALLNTSIDDFVYNHVGLDYIAEIPFTAPGVDLSLHGMLREDTSFFAMAPIDKKIIGTTAFGNFNSGETKAFDLAFVTCYDSTSSFLSIVDTLKRDVAIIKQLYNQGLFACTSIGLGLPSETPFKELLLYPNPSNEYLWLQTDEAITEVLIFDVQGKEQTKATTGFKAIDISNLSSGVYSVHIKTANGLTVAKRFVKQ
jgi:hypothetical protein